MIDIDCLPLTPNIKWNQLHISTHTTRNSPTHAHTHRQKHHPRQVCVQVSSWADSGGGNAVVIAYRPADYWLAAVTSKYQAHQNERVSVCL